MDCIDYLIGDATVIPRAWELLTHSSARMREKAAIALAKLWDPRAATGIEDPVAQLRKLRRDEGELHVRRCLEALQGVVEGNLRPQRLHDEFVLKRDDGLRMPWS